MLWLCLIHSEVNIAVVAVFTKYDIVINEAHRKTKRGHLSDTDFEEEVKRKAQASFDDRIKDFRASTEASIVRVSTRKNYRLSRFPVSSTPL
jgi:hypothetical protein